MDFALLTESAFFPYILFIVGLVTGIVGSMGGPGGLIITPFMILSGLPPQMAIGTTKTSSLGLWVIALIKYHKAGKINWRYVPALSVLAIGGGIIGASLMISIDETLIYPVVGTTLLLIAPLALLNKNFGMETRTHGKKRKAIGYVLYFLVMIFAGFFGGGAGTLVIMTLVTFLGFKTLDAHATDIPGWIMLTIVSSAIFAWHGYVDLTYAAIIFVSMAIGGYIGAHIALKGGDRFIKWFVCGFAVIVGIKLLFFSP